MVIKSKLVHWSKLELIWYIVEGFMAKQDFDAIFLIFAGFVDTNYADQISTPYSSRRALMDSKTRDVLFVPSLAG